jgi:hypothetical protein
LAPAGVDARATDEPVNQAFRDGLRRGDGNKGRRADQQIWGIAQKAAAAGV